MPDGVEMGPLGTAQGIPTTNEDGDLEGWQNTGNDAGWPNIYKSRGKPRVMECGSGLFFRAVLNPGVFFFAAIVVWGFVIFAFADNVIFGGEFNRLQGLITDEFSWLYILAINFFGIFCFFLIFSKYGEIILAPKDNPEPDFPYYSWFSMLFSAGVGIGLFFFGVWEPIEFYTYPNRDNYNWMIPGCPFKENPAACFTPASRYARANIAMNLSWFDWGIAASACYVVFGLPLAFYHYRYGMPLSVRSAFYPLIGNRIYGWFGDIVDAFCIIGTIFGVCTSLGLGVTQMVTGMGNLDPNIKSTAGTYIIVILCITAVATMSVVTGLDVGIRRLSEVNFVLGIVLLSMMFFMGKPEFFLDLFVQNVGYHIQHLPETSFHGGAMERHVPKGPNVPLGGRYPGGFEGYWTIFYWGWWFSWSPFVGTFLARISKGRTVREFVIGNMIVPTLLTSIWFTIFGGAGIQLQMLSENMNLDCCGSVSYTNQTWYDEFMDEISEGVEAEGVLPAVDPFNFAFSKKNGTCEHNFARWREQRVEREMCVGPYDLCTHDKDGKPKFANLACRISRWQGRSMLFDVLKWHELSEFTMPLAIAGLFTYFITSSDSASQVSDMIASNGDLEPPYWQRVFWSVSEGMLAIILIQAGASDDGSVSTDALWAVSAASICAGLPLVLIMIVLCYATYKALDLEYRVMRGEQVEELVQYNLPFPDALVQMCGKCCCGLGAFWCTEGGDGSKQDTPIMQCINACCSCFCPHLMVLRGLLKTTEGVVWQVLTAVGVLVPWVMMFVFFGLCPQWLAVFDSWFTTHTWNPKKSYNDKKKVYTGGYDTVTGVWDKADQCHSLGYYALGCTMYLIMVGFTMCFRNRVRNSYNIQGNACEDVVMTLFCPHVVVYQSFNQTLSPEPEAAVASDLDRYDAEKENAGINGGDKGL